MPRSTRYRVLQLLAAAALTAFDISETHETDSMFRPVVKLLARTALMLAVVVLMTIGYVMVWALGTVWH